jgi:hypothetical protein
MNKSPLGWFLTESGEWSCDIDDLPLIECAMCGAEVTDQEFDPEYCVACAVRLDAEVEAAQNAKLAQAYSQDVKLYGPAEALCHFLSKVFQ